ncbi:MAG: TIGR02594 family protein [Nitrosomonas sp.]|uniref:TIGR02594 family protein n=1 Tax=Nitrosomonas sp. TaxID=42353 RepID=UPI0032EFC6AD
MITRRKFISYSGGVIGGVAINPNTTFATISESEQGNCISQYEKLGLSLMTPEDDLEFGSLIRGTEEGGKAVGTGSSNHSDVATAFRILFNRDLLERADKEGHIGVARYLENITLKNKQGNLFNAEWGTGSGMANPLIVCLFGLTNTAPSDGDQTSWCSAFVNFCLYAAGQPGTFSALSGSFRNYGKDYAKEPKVGDIVVFQNQGESGNKGSGHVGFFVDEEKDNITVLGGNQGKEGKGTISTKTIPKVSKSMFLHSIRRRDS